MADQSYFQSGGINLYINPMIPQMDGALIRAVNVDSIPLAAKVKRPGYISYLGTPDNNKVYSLFSWTQDNGTQQNVYRASGSLLYYSAQGTAAWAVCGNGTITPGSQVGYSVLNNTLVISQNGGTTRHSTNGTSFSDTNSAPAGGFVEQYQNRIHITGSSSAVSYSVTGDPTNWAASGTSDGGVFTVPGAGLPNKLLKLADRLLISKNYQQLFRWDGYQLVDMATSFGLSSPFSYGSVEDNGFWLNQRGFFTSDGGGAQLISNPILRFIENNTGTAIAGTSFQSAPACDFKYDYLCAVGSMADDFTYETIPNAIIKYNFQKNEFLNYTFNNFPTAMHSFTNASGSQTFIFGDTNGQCYSYGGTALTDNGAAIESIMEYIFTFASPYYKEWRTWIGYFNPGCQAQIMYALGDSFLKEDKNWTVLGDAVEGMVRYKFPAGARSKLLFIKIIESSRNTRFNYYGCVINANILPIH